MPTQPATTKLGTVRVAGDSRREPGDDGAPPAPTVAEMFEYLSGQMSEIAISVSAGRGETAALRGEVIPQLSRLNRKVFGSRPPPFETSIPVVPGELVIHPKPTSPPLVKQMATHGTTIDTLAQEVSNLRVELGVVRSMNGQQSKAMGLAPPAATLAKRTSAYVGSPRFIRDLIALMTATGVALGAVRMLHTPPPPPAAPMLSVPAGTR